MHNSRRHGASCLFRDVERVGMLFALGVIPRANNPILIYVNAELYVQMFLASNGNKEVKPAPGLGKQVSLNVPSLLTLVRIL